MKLQITQEMVEELKSTAKEDTRQESCAVLFGHKVNRTTIIDGYLFVPNRHRDPECFFQINKGDIPKELLPKIVGVFHTHLEGHQETPTAQDIAELPKDMLGLLLYVPDDEVHAYGKSLVKLVH